MTLKKLIEEKISDPKIQLIYILLASGLTIVFAYWRSSEKGGNKFLHDQLERCEKRLEQCESGRIADLERCQKRLDTMLLKMVELKIELENIKTGGL